MAAGDDLQGLTAIVTGASRGIGRAVADLFASQGARLVLVARDEAELTALSHRLAHDDGQRPAVVAGDLGASDTAGRAVATALEATGRLDIVVNVAGVFPTMRLEETSDEAYSTTLTTNLQAPFRLCRAATPALRRQPGSAIVNVSSMAARLPTPGLAAYSASKAGLEALTRALAVELSPGIRVNAVSPGPTLTDAVRELMLTDTTGAVDSVVRTLPLGRLAEPEEIAEAILFLASRRSSYITGQVLHVNGGGLMA